MPNEKLERMIETQYYPFIPRDEIAAKCRYKLNKGDLVSVGGPIAALASELGRLVINPSSNEGLYRCVFPNGVSGTLAQAKDGSGFLGTIMNNGIVGQARWIPANGSATTIPINPAIIAIAITLVGINKKLDDIKQTQNDILNFLENDKESKLKGSVNALFEIMNDYRFNFDNMTWKNGKFVIASDIKTKAESSIIFYRGIIKDEMDKRNAIHSNQQAQKIINKVQQNFKRYQLSIYLYAYAAFVEVVLGDNYNSEYLDKVSERIEDNSFQYYKDYTECYDMLSKYTSSSVGTAALKGLGNASKSVGNVIAKIPIIRKGPVDEVLIAAGNSAKKLSSQNSEKALHEFSDKQGAGVYLFVENIETINTMNNQAIEMMFDQDTIYVCT